jgi:hypothetical protein
MGQIVTLGELQQDIHLVYQIETFATLIIPNDDFSWYDLAHTLIQTHRGSLLYF